MGRLPGTGGNAMNWDQIQGNWKEMKGRAIEAWGELTDDELTKARGDRTQVEGLIQQKYGKTKDEARKTVDDWMSTL